MTNDIFAHVYNYIHALMIVMIGNTIFDSIQTDPRLMNVRQLNDRCLVLENQILTKYCQVYETVIIP